MPISSAIHVDQGVIVMRLSGKVTYRDLVKALGELWRDERAIGTTARIIDLRECLLVLKVDEAQLVSRMEWMEAKRFGTRKVAVVLPPLADRSMLRILQREVIQHGVEVKFFDDLAEVMRFIEAAGQSGAHLFRPPK